MEALRAMLQMEADKTTSSALANTSPSNDHPNGPNKRFEKLGNVLEAKQDTIPNVR